MTGFSCVVMGNESLLVQCSEALLARGNHIMAVVTRNPGIADWAASRGLRVEAPGADLAIRLGAGYDWLLSIANLSIIPDDVLALATRGAVNFHDGPLPRHAGLAVGQPPRGSSSARPSRAPRFRARAHC